MDLQEIRTRYSVAFDAYHDIARRNAVLAGSGGHPSANDLQLEQRALGVLEAARRALVDALALPSRD
jgi:hypothetical protein